MLPLRYDNPKQVYTLVEDILQVLSAIATTATFYRVIEDYGISKIFLILPVLIFGFIITRKHPALRQDIHTMSMLSGATTGINSGFLSSVVVEKSWKHILDDNGKTLIEDNFTKAMLLRQLEFLHLPVVFGSILYTYCVVFDRLPSRQSTRLAASTALCGAIMITMTTTLGGETTNILSLVQVFLTMFIFAFLLGIIPVIKGYQRPWMICVLVFLLLMYWQSNHFDTLVWNWEECKYPIPGSITAMIVMLMINVHESADTKVVTNAENLMSKDKNLSDNPDFAVIDIREVLMNAFSWHGVTFVIERISLSFIKNSKKRHVNALNVAQQPHGSDVWISCLTMAAFVGVMSPQFKANHVIKLAIVLGILLFYISATVTKGILQNAYFIDMIIGLTTVYFCHNKYYLY